MADPSSSFQRSYDAFLDFRGKTPNNFTPISLRSYLRTKGVNTFIDEEKLERGQAVSAALVSAIENSMFSIIVLSENYASSRWCLEELVKIIQCMKNRGQRVLPIFYNVDPSDVRNHMGKFGEALAKHEENSKEGMERVQIWKDALTQVTNFSGWDSRNKIMMHDLIQEMGMEIVRQESHNPGQRSRLWLHKDINDALKKNMENEKIEGIFLDLSHSQEIIDFSTQAFPRMYKLRLLKVYESNKISRNFGDTLNRENCKVHFSPNFRFCYDELRYLYLYGYSLKSLDNDFNAKNLVHLSMQYSHIKRLWKGIKVLEKLKVMDLSHSKSLIETPDFSRVPNLERLVLEGCISLHKVHPSLGVLNKLNFLSLKNCEKLKSLPSSMCDLKSSKHLFFRLFETQDFPENFGNLEMLKELHADGILVISIWEQLCYFAKHRGLSSLEGALLEKCKRRNLAELPSSIYSLIAQDYISLKNASNKVLKSLFPTTKSPRKLSSVIGVHLIYVMVYGSRIPDWIRYRARVCRVRSRVATLYKTPLFSNWHNGTPINWHEVTHIVRESPVIQFSSISSPPLPNKSTIVLKEIHKEEEPGGSGWSNVDGSNRQLDYHTAMRKNPLAKETARRITTTTKIIYDVTIYGVAFKIMTPLNLKFIKVTHHIKIFN
ncbi:hypothetical protein AAG906_006576 [Vitis piasezkii]